jgi:hypothetical protein
MFFVDVVDEMLNMLQREIGSKDGHGGSHHAGRNRVDDK